MNTLAHARALSCAAILGLALTPRLVAIEQPPNPADQAWADLQAAMVTPASPRETPSDSATRRQLLTNKAARLTATANRAKAFYTAYPQHVRAGEARKYEVQALVSSVQAGEAMAEDRLNSTVHALRADQSVPTAIRVQAVSAYEFYRGLKGTRTREDRLVAIEQVARNLLTEFPDQPQGFESLLTVAAISDDVDKARKLSRELQVGPAPSTVKTGAQALAARLALVGRSLATELDEAGANATKDVLIAGRPTVIYTWATWSPGSLTLVTELKKHVLSANLIGLNLDQNTPAAEKLAHEQALPGILHYDSRGLAGSLARRLQIRGAPQVYLIDAAGIIRDIHAETGLDRKLSELGF